MTDQSEYVTYFNGEWVPHGQVRISPDDRGFTLSDAVFDIARTFDGRPFRLENHIDRLYRSMRYLRIDSGIAAEEMTEICREVVRRNEQSRPQVGDFTINPFVTRGPSLDGPPTVCVRVKPVAFATFARAYVEGAQALIATARSYSTDSMDPKVKHHSRLNMVLAELEASDVGPDAQPIMLDRDGNVTEGIGWNVFAVADGSILQGVSRRVVMELADQLDLTVIEEDMQPYDLYTADEVFFTRTSPRIVPVREVDGRPVAREVPGPVTKQLLAAHSDMVGVDIVEQALRYGG
jgi:branched-chain amino acid aminotransferase